MIPLLTSLQRRGVHRKLVFMMLASCCGTMIVAGVALFAFLSFALRDSFRHDAAALTEIIAANCAGSVAFGDPAAAAEVMQSLRAQEHVVGAVIRLPDGEQFAGTGRVEIALQHALPPNPTPAQQSVWVNNTYLLLTSPIRVRNETIGTFTLVSDFGPIYLRLFKSYLAVFAFTFLGVMCLGYALTLRAQRDISDPLRSLADSAKVMWEKQDYTVRAEKGAGGEVGQLADAFNLMVERMEAGVKLAKEVAQRQRIEAALRESEERFRSLFENATIGLYRSSQQGEFLMANPALLAMLGCQTFDELVAGCAGQQPGRLPAEREIFCEQLERTGRVDEAEGHWRRADGKLITVRESAKAIRDADGGILYFEGCVEDITARTEADAELQRLHRELVDASRAAGMAEVATGVLHNVGNVLNSVSVSAQLLHEQVGRSRMASLRQAVALLEQNLPRLGVFLTEDPKGRLLPDFLIKVTQHLAAERQNWQDELRQLKTNIEHMKEIVAMQQNYARVGGLAEPLSAPGLVEDALRMNLPSLERQAIGVVRDFAEVPPVLVDKHKVLQILTNLIHNARQALDEGAPAEKRLELKIFQNGSGNVKIVVQDNGVGIPKENLTRIFSHGFTTRANGHGFGLHSGAIAAKELGGSLTAASDGPGCGATFTLELPAASTKN